MDDFFKNLKDRFSFDNVVSFMKDAKLIGEEKEEPKTSTENKVDDIPRTTTVMDVDGTPIIITDAGSMSKTKLESSNTKTNISNKSSFSILQKSTSEVKVDVDSKTENSEKPSKKPVDVPLFF